MSTAAAPRRVVCFVDSNRPWGGGEKFHLEHARHCRDQGWAVHVVAHAQGELARRVAAEPGLTLHAVALGNLSFLNPLAMLRLRALFRRMGADTVVAALPADLKAAGTAARWAGVGQVVYRRGIAVPVRDTALNRWLYGRVVDRLIVNSLETKRCVLAHNPQLIDEARIRLVPNGFDLAAFDALPGAEALPPDSPLRRRGGEVLVGNAARLTAQKGQALLLEAVRQLTDDGLDVRLLLAGAGPDEAALRERTRELGLKGRVEFLGFMQNLKGFYESIDIFALPSLWEGFGYALVEAMAARRPVAAFDTSSIPEVVVHGETGRLAPPRDVPALADALARLARDPAERARLGEAGRRRVQENYALDRTLPAFLRALDADAES
ncbi:MAG: glycosyltransferase [Desulfovibrionaceae bacterium]